MAVLTFFEIDDLGHQLRERRDKYRRIFDVTERVKIGLEIKEAERILTLHVNDILRIPSRKIINYLRRVSPFEIHLISRNSICKYTGVQSRTCGEVLLAFRIFTDETKRVYESSENIKRILSSADEDKYEGLNKYQKRVARLLRAFRIMEALNPKP